MFFRKTDNTALTLFLNSTVLAVLIDFTYWSVITYKLALPLHFMRFINPREPLVIM